ncbi:NAD-dependent epimerase/dehydratase family protein [Rufibacter roseus]|uniref:NAD-dependent epimerase/dehydratase family protein n=1 Tax=Rufibacter roseus TaxID=1567108 RepID=A0ABW2DLR0_9BACT|nr:NAD-dependent epimerase/dehydratase family protein [Rufibacter roseus]
MKKEVILVIGSNGQIGTALLPVLKGAYGAANVVSSDLRAPIVESGIFETLDATNADQLANVVRKYRVTQIYHLAAILSAKGEADPLWAWDLNMKTLLNVFEVARENQLDKVFVPSSIAVFGASAPVTDTPQLTYLDPATVYGVSKVAAENWSVYYHKKYGLDVRSLRYPGVISYETMPGGGTTDYAVDIFHKAVLGEEYECFLKEDTSLPMIYMPDATRATLELMEAESDKIKIRSSYNLAGMSFTPAELLSCIQSILPHFSSTFKPDFRQTIADSWPNSIDDSMARQQWGWKPIYDLSSMTKDMIEQLTKKYTLEIAHESNRQA